MLHVHVSVSNKHTSSHGLNFHLFSHFLLPPSYVFVREVGENLNPNAFNLNRIFLFSVLRCCGLINMKRLQAQWTAQSEFSELILENNIINHHLPYVMLENMLKLQKQKSTLNM